MLDHYSPSAFVCALRDRFGLLMRLDYYTDSEMEKIVDRSAGLLKMKIAKNVAKEIAKISSHSPTSKQNYQRAHDMLVVNKHAEISSEVLTELFHCWSLMILD